MTVTHSVPRAIDGAFTVPQAAGMSRSRTTAAARATPLPRRLMLLAPLALATCSSPPPVRTVFPPLRYDYLLKLRLNVATIAIDDSWQPGADPRELGAYAPQTPVSALRQMATDRLVAAGASGRGVFTIEDASLVREGDHLDCHLAVRLSVSSADGTRSAYAEARVARAATLPEDDDPPQLRDALYTLVQNAMDDMNVEFEYQVRRSLRDWLANTAGTAPPPPAVEAMPLPPPGAPGGVPPAPMPDGTLPMGTMPMGATPLAPPGPPAAPTPPLSPGAPMPLQPSAAAPMTPPTMSPPPRMLMPP
jgi:hypothetical protein